MKKKKPWRGQIVFHSAVCVKESHGTVCQEIWICVTVDYDVYPKEENGETELGLLSHHQKQCNIFI